MQASYDYCPTGNEADINGATNPVTTAGLGNPVRQGAVPYDDGTKDYISGDGVILENYNGTGTQVATLAPGGCESGCGTPSLGQVSGFSLAGFWPGGSPLPLPIPGLSDGQETPDRCAEVQCRLIRRVRAFGKVFLVFACYSKFDLEFCYFEYRAVDDPDPKDTGPLYI